mmetsp:Transcript_83766/g.194876  ORF Transcript_83766/g.194876 Transcript_83766/m.194876 type:complete len:371 (+) Transcript_83766:50-1162(+)
MKAAASDDLIAKILSLCVAMYAFIAVCWSIYWYMLKRRNETPSLAAQRCRVGLLCVTWSSMSVGMHISNKVLMNSVHAPAVVSTVQMLIAVMVMTPIFGGQLLQVQGQALRCWMIVPVFFAAMLCTSCYTYQYISLSFLTVVRNMTPLVVLPIEATMMPPEKQPQLTPMVVVALGVMIAGTVAYAGQMQKISWIGIVFAAANMILASCDRLIQRFLLTGVCSEMPSGVCTVLNNSLGMIPSFALALVTHQVADIGNHAQVHGGWGDFRILILLALSGVIGIGICYLGFECQREITATSFFVLQNVSKVAVVCAGILIFEDPIRSPSSGIGLLLSIGGSFMYGKLQMSGPAEAKSLLKKVDGGAAVVWNKA